MRVVILGAGFGGLELATLLSHELGQDATKRAESAPALSSGE